MSRLATPTRLDHDECLRACWHHQDKISDPEFWLLNTVAGNYAARERVTLDDLRTARAILRRIDSGQW